jgi:hypothetical protein
MGTICYLKCGALVELHGISSQKTRAVRCHRHGVLKYSVRYECLNAKNYGNGTRKQLEQSLNVAFFSADACKLDVMQTQFPEGRTKLFNEFH